MVNGFDSLVVTKMDVLDELDEIPVCVAYELNGKRITGMPATNRQVEELKPVYETIPGWKENTKGISRFEELPSKAKQYLAFLEQQCAVEVGCVSTGPERTETIVVAGSKLAGLLNPV